MKVFFYNRSVYRVIQEIQLPNCFLEIDEYFDKKFTDPSLIMKNSLIAHTENICNRIGNVDFYAFRIANELDIKSNLFQSAILISSYLIGYFSSCKSFLDSLAIALNDIYKLNLSNKEKDFSKGVFWKKLEQVDAPIKKEYYSYFDLYQEVISWRDLSVHRVSPFVVIHSPTPPEKTSRELQSIKLLADTNQFGVLSLGKTKGWYDVLELHKKWHPSFLKLCEDILNDIKDKI